MWGAANGSFEVPPGTQLPPHYLVFVFPTDSYDAVEYFYVAE